MKNFQNRSTDDWQKAITQSVPVVTEYMTPASKLITLEEDTPILSAIQVLLNNRITGAPVLNKKGEVVGLIDDKDCLNVLLGSTYYNQPAGKDTVGSFMTNVMKEISVDFDMVRVANVFLTTPYKRLLVKDHSGKLVGQISRRDVLKAIKDMNMYG
ncbi:CBS domain-containing protein [Jiulongibacter sp. NS-SX5]|uniref:CBS domain-containing protein n=1 Tax=Jiulongibacter sp. NS-SX5 TaxID=3463854 RepID=UPI0040586DF9